MRIVRDDLWLCADCTQVACNGISGMAIEGTPRAEEVARGLKKLGPYLAPAFDSNTGEGILEFSSIPCAACKEWRGGYRAEFATLGQ